MPRTCYYCRFQLLKSLSLGDNRLVYFHSCSLLCKNVDDYENNRREDCPLVEVPTPHGDLIDRNEVLNSCEFIGEKPTWDNPYTDDAYGCKSSVIENIKAVIKAEE